VGAYPSHPAVGIVNQFRPGLTGNDQALGLRSTLQGELVLDRLALVGELQDARAYLTDQQSHVSTTLVDAFDLLQAYVRVGAAGSTAARAPEVMIGRFSMELGSGRLIAQELFRDMTRSSPA
jgi:Alginate export